MADWIDDAEAACDEAAPGPWDVYLGEGGLFVRAIDDTDHEYRSDMEPILDMAGEGPDAQADAKFIALSRTALPRALAALKAADELARIAQEDIELSQGRFFDALAVYHKAMK